MAEYKVKPINQLQLIDAKDISDEDYFPIYETTDAGETGKITAGDLKEYIFKNQNTYAADSTFKVQPVTINNKQYNQLTIGKQSLVINNVQLNKFYEQMGVPLKVNEASSFRGIKQIQGGNGITVTVSKSEDSQDGSTDDILTISFSGQSGEDDPVIGAGKIKIKKDTDEYEAPIQDGFSEIKFTGNGVTLKDNTISINDNNTILQAYKPGEEPVNIKSIKEGTGINFSFSEDSDQGRELTIENSSDTIANSLSLKIYKLTNTGRYGQHYTSQEDFTNEAIVAVQFDRPPQFTPITINGHTVKYLNTENQLNQIIEKFAILQYSTYEDEQWFDVLTADKLPNISQDIQEQEIDDTRIRLTFTVNNQSKSFEVLAKESITRDDILIKKEGSDEQIINPQLIQKASINWTDMQGTIPIDKLPDGIGDFVIVDGTEIKQLPDLSEDTLAFTHGAKIIPTAGGSSGGTTLKRGYVSNNPFINEETIYVYQIDGIDELSTGFYLINFKYGPEGENISPKIGLKNGTGGTIKPIYYNGSYSTEVAVPNTLITSYDNVLFYYDSNVIWNNNSERGVFYLIAVDNAMGERILLSSNENNSILYLRHKNKTYNIPTDNLASKTVHSGSTNLISIEEDNNNITIDFDIPQNNIIYNQTDLETLKEMFLDGTGSWQPLPGPLVNNQLVHNISSNSLDLLINNHNLTIEKNYTEDSYNLYSLLFKPGYIYQSKYLGENTFNPNGANIPVNKPQYSQYYIFSINQQNCPNDIILATGDCWLTPDEIDLDILPSFWDLIDYNENTNILTWEKVRLYPNNPQDLEKINKIRQFRETVENPV